MKPLRMGVFVAIALLLVFAIFSFIPYPPSIEAARRAGFSDMEITRGQVRSFESRLIFWGAQFVQLVLVCWAGLTSGGRRLAEFCLSLCGHRVWLATLLAVFALASLRELLLLPFNVLGFYQSRRWGMLAESYSLGSWGSDYFFSTTVEAFFLLVGTLFFWGLVKGLPKIWWCVAPVGGGVFAILYATLAPLVLDPMMNRFVPLEQTQWSDLKPQLMELVAKAELSVQEILVMDASKRSTHSNAYFAGFGSTRRIVLYDTLLKRLSAAEIEAVLAHEIGHWENDHIVYGISLGVLGLWFACWLVDWILLASLRQEPWRAEFKHDPRLIGWLMLLIFLGQWLARPIENQISRRFERQADWRALELIDNPQFAMECEKRMAIDNQANVAPSPWNSWMFSTHPSTVERIETAKSWKP